MIQIIFDDGVYRIYKISDKYEIYMWGYSECIGSFDTEARALKFLGL
jgi:hypothetical protein